MGLDDLDACLFCGGPAGTKEDVVPKWLLRRLPSSPRAYLPNDTWMSSFDMKVPACARDNNEVFGELEQHMEAGTFTEDEAFLWAFKVHAGLCHLGARLKENRSDPASGPMSVLGLTGEQLQSFYAQRVGDFRRFVRVWKSPHHRFRPSPPGSVFLLDSLAPGIADWFHSPLGAVGVNLGAKFLAVLLFDGCYAKREQFDRYWSEEAMNGALGAAHPNICRVSSKPVSADQENLERRRVYQRAWVGNATYECCLARLSFSMSFRSNQALVRPEPSGPPLPHDPQLQLACLQLVGLYPHMKKDGTVGVALSPQAV